MTTKYTMLAKQLKEEFIKLHEATTPSATAQRGDVTRLIEEVKVSNAVTLHTLINRIKLIGEVCFTSNKEAKAEMDDLLINYKSQAKVYSTNASIKNVPACKIVVKSIEDLRQNKLDLADDIVLELEESIASLYYWLLQIVDLDKTKKEYATSMLAELETLSQTDIKEVVSSMVAKTKEEFGIKTYETRKVGRCTDKILNAYRSLLHVHQTA